MELSTVPCEEDSPNSERSYTLPPALKSPLSWNVLQKSMNSSEKVRIKYSVYTPERILNLIFSSRLLQIEEKIGLSKHAQNPLIKYSKMIHICNYVSPSVEKINTKEMPNLYHSTSVTKQLPVSKIKIEVTR